MEVYLKWIMTAAQKNAILEECATIIEIAIVISVGNLQSAKKRDLVGAQTVGPLQLKSTQ